MSKKKVTFWIEEGEVELLKLLFNTDNQSETIRLATMQSLATEDSEKVKTLFPYIGKKPPRIDREVVEAFKQSECEIFVDLFCGSLAMLCYLPWDMKVVVNDIDGNLTNLYKVIRDSPSDFVSEVMKLPYSEVLFKEFKEDLMNADNMSELDRAVAYFYVSFGAYRGRIDNPLFHISTTANTNRAEDYQKSIQWILQLSKRLQSVEILNRDFRKVLKSYNAEDVFVYADCPYLGTEDYYDYVFTPQDHKDLAEMLKDHKGKFALSSKAKKELRKLYRSNNHYVLNFEDTYRLPDKRHREQLILNFEMKHVNKECKMKGCIIKNNEISLIEVLKSINNLDKYNCLITDIECYPLDKEISGILGNEYCWIEGKELLRILEKEDFQWIWGVFSIFSKDITLEEVLKYDYPYADGYKGFWKNPIKVQHPLAISEIVVWDGSIILMISKNNEIINTLMGKSVYAKDLENYNRT